MRLTDLNPRWVGAGGTGVSNADGSPVPERGGVGISFDCPCGACGIRGYVAFENPLDGGQPYISPGQPTWQRTGDTFETLTLSPSILRTPPYACGWHGWIRNGEATNA
jgi:hypothetical protein